MAERKPLLMDKELYNLLNNGTRKPEPKDNMTSETPKKMLRSLQGIFCKGRYQSWVISQEYTQSKNMKKPRRNHE